MQLRYYGDLFAQRDIPVYVDDERNTVLRFPRRLVEEANAFPAATSGEIKAKDIVVQVWVVGHFDLPLAHRCIDV